MKVLVPLAEGFEEIEAVTIIDLLRRAGINAVSASTKNNPVKGSHGIIVTADFVLDELIADNENFDAVILPGGMPGTTNLKNDPRITGIIKKLNRSGALTAALCAAPVVLSEAGIMNGKRYTCYPGYEVEIPEGIHADENVIADGSIITGSGPASAAVFALKVIEFLKGAEAADIIAENIVSFW